MAKPYGRKSRFIPLRRCLSCGQPASATSLFCENCVTMTRKRPEVKSKTRSLRAVSGGLPTLGKRR
jgi:hypothetical protein